MLSVHTTNNGNKLQLILLITFVVLDVIVLYSTSVAAKTVPTISSTTTTRRSIILQPAFGLMRMATSSSSSSIDNNNSNNNNVVLKTTTSDNTNQANGRTCAIVGVGILGTSICKQLLLLQQSQEQQSLVYSKIYGITKTNNRHEQIIEQLMTSSSDDTTILNKSFISNTLHLVTTDETCIQKCDDVIFCAPPSGFTNYSNSIYESINKYWKGSQNNGGIFLFTSSGAIYGDTSGIVTEQTPIEYMNANVDASTNTDVIVPPRIQRLLDSESIVLQNNGTCIRLAGLYDLTRGAHNYWITSTTGSNSLQSTSSTGIINLVHYDDAASCCIAVLKKQQQLQQAKETTLQKQIFLCSDNNPLTRYDICYYALQANIYKNYTMPQFSTVVQVQASDTTTTTTSTGSSTEKSKIYDPTYTMTTLQWQPNYKSFQDFMVSNK